MVNIGIAYFVVAGLSALFGSLQSSVLQPHVLTDPTVTHVSSALAALTRAAVEQE